MSSDEQTSTQSNGTKICEIMHFYNKQRSNSIQIFIEDPFLKDGRWLTSGNVRVVLTKYGESNQVNAIKLTIAETSELIFRMQKGIELLIEKEIKMPK